MLSSLPSSVGTCMCCSSETLHRIAAHLHLIPPLKEGEATVYDPGLLLEVLVARHCCRPSQLQALNASPLYPTEEILWDENIVPYDYSEGDGGWKYGLDITIVWLDVCFGILCHHRLSSSAKTQPPVSDTP